MVWAPMRTKYFTPPPARPPSPRARSGETRSEEHTSELQSRLHLVCRLLLEKKTTHLPKLPLCAIRPFCTSPGIRFPAPFLEDKFGCRAPAFSTLSPSSTAPVPHSLNTSFN